MAELLSHQQKHADSVAELNLGLQAHAVRRADSSVYDTRAALLRQGIEAQQALLNSPHVQEALQNVASKVFTARAAAERPDDILPLTLASFDDFHFVTDRDGSMTEIKKTEREYLIPHGPGSVPLEAYLDSNGRDRLPEGFVRHIQPLLRRRPDIFREAGQHAGKLRDGVVELFTWLKERGTPRTILSANWRELVHGGLVGTPLADDPDLTTVAIEHNDITSIDKPTKLQLFAADQPNHIIVYVGDGESDMRAGEAYARGVVGWIFALKDSPFDQRLTEQQIPHSTYENYHEIMLQLQDADSRAQELQEQAA